MKRYFVLMVITGVIITFQPSEASKTLTKPMVVIDKELNHEVANDTLTRRINHNTTRSRYGNRAQVNSDIGVNEPGVNLVHREVRFKAGAELAEKVQKKGMAKNNSSFDVILKNGGSSLAMFEQNGYTYLNNNGLLVAHDQLFRIVLQVKGENSSAGNWGLVRSNEQRKSKGQGQVYDILKLKHSPMGKKSVLLEADKVPPGEYVLVWQPETNRSVDAQTANNEVEFCYQYLPYIETTLQLIEIDWDDELCIAPETISASGNITVEIVPANQYSIMKNNKGSQVRK